MGETGAEKALYAKDAFGIIRKKHLFFLIGKRHPQQLFPLGLGGKRRKIGAEQKSARAEFTQDGFERRSFADGRRVEENVVQSAQRSNALDRMRAAKTARRVGQDQPGSGIVWPPPEWYLKHYSAVLEVTSKICERAINRKRVLFNHPR